MGASSICHLIRFDAELCSQASLQCDKKEGRYQHRNWQPTRPRSVNRRLRILRDVLHVSHDELGVAITKRKQRHCWLHGVHSHCFHVGKTVLLHVLFRTDFEDAYYFACNALGCDGVPLHHGGIHCYGYTSTIDFVSGSEQRVLHDFLSILHHVWSYSGCLQLPRSWWWRRRDIIHTYPFEPFVRFEYLASQFHDRHLINDVRNHEWKWIILIQEKVVPILREIHACFWRLKIRRAGAVCSTLKLLLCRDDTMCFCPIVSEWIDEQSVQLLLRHHLLDREHLLHPSLLMLLVSMLSLCVFEILRQCCSHDV